MNLYTSDLHFGHTKVIQFDHRPFQDREQMDTYLIEQWNNRVQEDDTIYIIGDFCYHNRQAPEWYLRQLKGHKILIPGNHDEPILHNPKALHYLEGIERLMRIVDENRQIVLCHFPIAEWYGYFRNTWHIYGHIHNNKNETYEYMKTKKYALNAGCMINNFAPASMNELIYNNEHFQSTVSITSYNKEIDTMC